jgi:hypothetical protein
LANLAQIMRIQKLIKVLNVVFNNNPENKSLES